MYEWNLIPSQVTIRVATEAGNLCFGARHYDTVVKADTEPLWVEWQQPGNDEIRRNFGVDDRHQLGGVFNIKEGTLHEAMAPKLSHRASTPSNHKCALRKLFQARAHRRSSNGTTMDSEVMERLVTKLTSANTGGLLQRGISLAQDLTGFLERRPHG